MDMKCTRQKQQELLLDISPIACVKKGNGYSPLPSIWSGEDSELIDKMLAFYPTETKRHFGCNGERWAILAGIKMARHWYGY